MLRVSIEYERLIPENNKQILRNYKPCIQRLQKTTDTNTCVTINMCKHIWDFENKI